MLSAADYDIRGAVALVEPSAVIYDARQLDKYAWPSSPLPFDIAALQLDDPAAPASPLPFDITALQLDEPCTFPRYDTYPKTMEWLKNNLTIGWHPCPTNDSLMDAFQWRVQLLVGALRRYDYAVLQEYVRNKFNFNTSHKIIHPFTITGCVSPVLVMVARDLPGNHNFAVDATVRLVQWLIAHGADPACVDPGSGLTMMQTLDARADICWSCVPEAYDNRARLKLALQAANIK